MLLLNLFKSDSELTRDELIKRIMFRGKEINDNSHGKAMVYKDYHYSHLCCKQICKDGKLIFSEPVTMQVETL